jgi:hypothetical protein
MHFFTIATNNYIPKARVLAKSLKKNHPSSEFFLILCDTIPEGFNPENEIFDDIILITDLGIPNLDSWIFKHSVVELCTAVKAISFLKIFDITNCKKIVYLDPDIAVFNNFNELESLLDNNSIIITPHLTTPDKTIGGIRDNEICALQHGIYNLGFLAVSMDNEGLSFLTWWKERLTNFCYDDIPTGIFTDQRWIDLVPAFFNNVFILKDPSYNVAPWNISNRLLSKNNNGQILTNGIPLHFFHFSSYDSGACQQMLAKYDEKNAVVEEIFKLYSKELQKNENSRFKKIPWNYSFFSNNEMISAEQRIIYRNRDDLISAFPSPSKVTADNNCFYSWYKNEYPKELGNKLDLKSENESNRGFFSYLKEVLNTTLLKKL